MAALPGLFGLPAVGYAGMAVVNSLWQLLFHRDSPEPIYLLGGLAYGLIFGVIFQCLLLGTASTLAWRLGLHRLSPWLTTKSKWTRFGLWVGVEAIYLASLTWAFLAMLAYGLAAALAAVIHPGLK